MDSVQILGLTWQAWVTIITVLGMFLTMMFTKVKAQVAFLATISILFITGVLDVKDAFGGFSSESVIVVAVLFVVIAGLTYTGVLNWIAKNVMGTPKTLSGAIVRLMIPVAALSSMLSNTTVVALFINVVKMWSRKLGITPSKLLIPLSYAAGMGGICTLIGTPPNLIISGLYDEDYGTKLGILTPTLCGLFCLTVGILSTLAMQKLLPERTSPMSKSKPEDFFVEFLVPSDHHTIGMTIQEAREKCYGQYNDVKIAAIRRFDGEIIKEVADDEFIMGRDKILFGGDAKTLLTLSKLYNLHTVHMQGVLEAEADETNVKPYKTALSSLILVAMVALSAFNVLPMLTCCLLAAFAMILCKCCTSDQAMKAIEWNIIIVFAGSVAIGKAIEQTGLAGIAANRLLEVCGSNPLVALTATCFVATFITEFISNTAAAAMFYPIAMSTATATGANPLTFAVALMISASSSFATPIGSPTHLLVYGPGGYNFTDFMRIGIPMNIIILIANVFITTIVFPL